MIIFLPNWQVTSCFFLCWQWYLSYASNIIGVSVIQIRDMTFGVVIISYKLFCGCIMTAQGQHTHYKTDAPNPSETSTQLLHLQCLQTGVFGWKWQLALCCNKTPTWSTSQRYLTILYIHTCVYNETCTMFMTNKHIISNTNRQHKHTIVIKTHQAKE